MFVCATAEAARQPIAPTGPGSLDLSYPAQATSLSGRNVDPSLLARKRLTQSQTSRRGGHPSEFDDRLLRPTFLWAPAGLTAEAPMALQATALLEAAGRDALAKQAFLLGLTSTDIADATLALRHDLGHGALIAAYQQRFEGDEVFGRRLSVTMNRRFGVVATSGHFEPLGEDARSRATSLGFDLDVPQTAAAAFADLGGRIDASQLSASRTAGAYSYFVAADTGSDYHLIGEVRAKRVRFPADGELLPAYYVELQAATIDGGRDDYYAYVISAIDGRVLFRNSLKQYESFSYRAMADASGEFQPFDSPLGNGYLPLPSLDSNASYTRTPATPNLPILQNSPLISTGDPWLAPSATVTTGNNTDAYLDLAAPDGYQANRGDIRPTLTSTLSFDYTPAVDTDPTTDAARNAAAVNLFFVNNWLHDFWYDRGFAEADGNAQADNYSRGGVAGDRILAQGQDFSGTNNANMATPADGGSPRMQMYLFDGPFDGALSIVTPALGDLAAAPASFGPTSFSVQNDVVAYVDGSTGADGGGSPTDGCEAATNAAELSGKIALIDRNYCEFTVKITNAQNARAVGVIVVNLKAGEAPFTMGGTAPRITIPSLMTSLEDGSRIREALSAGTVTAHLLRNPSTPYDGTLDNSIVGHEFFHYVSNRLVGNGSGLSNTQGGAMGEGWSDFNALLMSVRAEDRAVVGNDRYQAPYSTGFYATNEPYFGIRRAPYSTNFAVNPLTFKYVTNGVALPTTAPIAFGQDGESNAQVHNSGEIWSEVLWEAYAALLNDPRYSFQQARQKMQEYIIGGLKATPSSPTFLEARDGILAVAKATDDSDHDIINAAFARRGMGVYAVAAPRDSSDNVGVVESFVSQTLAPQIAQASFSMTVQDASGGYCDTDSVLDSGETGLFNLRLPIDGNTALQDGTLATVSEVGGNNLILAAGDQLELLPDPADAGYLIGSIRMGLIRTSSAPYNVNIEVALPELGTDVVAQFVGTQPTGDQLQPYYTALVNYDLSANTRANDDMEKPASSQHDWTTAKNGNAPGWHVADYGSSFGTGLAWWSAGSDQLSETILTSPVIAATTLTNLSIAFDHYFAYAEATGSPLTGPDGGLLEISVDRGEWSDVTRYATFTTGGYNGRLSSQGNRPAYVGSLTGMTHVELSFGTRLAGSNVRLRYRQIANDGYGSFGWLVDNVVVTGAAPLPFSSVVNENNTCGNHPPFADAGPDTTVPMLQADGRTPTVVVLQGSASDLDGTANLSYSWRQLSGPAVTLSSATVAQPSFPAPAVTSNQALVFALTVSDGSAQSSDSVTVTVTPSNRAPVANAGPDATVSSLQSDGVTPTTVTLQGSGTDPDGTTELTYAWRQVSGPTVTLSSSTVTAPSFPAPSVSASQVLVFELAVSDGSAQGTDTVSITVQPSNHAPVANAGADATVSSLQADGRTPTTVVLRGSATDADGTSGLSYAWRQLSGPSVTLSSRSIAAPSFPAPTVNSSVALVFELTVSDGTLQSSDQVTVTVLPSNRAPIANAGADLRALTGSLVTLDGAASSDPDGSIAGYAWTQTAGPAVSLSSASAAQPGFVPTQAGRYSFSLVVTDNLGLSSNADAVVVTVQVAPVANAGADQTVALPVTVTLDGSGSSDADGSVVAFAWTQTAGAPVTLSSASTTSPSFAPTAPGTYDFLLTVTDNDGNTASDGVRIVVLAPPTAAAGSDVSALTGATVTLDGSGSSDADGSIVTDAWTQTAGPEVSLSGADSATPSFSSTSSGVYAFTLTVTDDSGLSSSDSISVTLRSAPVASAGAAQTVAAGTAVTLNGSASSDADGSIASYAWTQNGGPVVTLAGASTATASFTPTTAGRYEFTLTVTDDSGLSASATTVVDVTAVAERDEGGGGGSMGAGGLLVLLMGGALRALRRRSRASQT